MRSSRAPPASPTASMITGYSLIDGRLQDERRHLLRHAQGFQGALRFGRHRADAECARDAGGYVRGGAARSRKRSCFQLPRPRSRASARPAALNSGSRTLPPATLPRLDELTQAFLVKARTRPELTGVTSTFRANTQQLRAVVDRDKATLLGVPIEDVYSAIQAQFGSLTASQFNQFSRVWWVIVQSDAKYPSEPGGPYASVHALQPRTRWCRSLRSSTRSGLRGPICCRISMAFRRRR